MIMTANRRVIEEMHGSGRMYKFVERNQLGEKIMVQIRKAKTDTGVGGDNHPRYWLSVTTLVTDKRGNVQEKYNPQVQIIRGRKAMDRKWVLEPNAENVQRLLKQVERLAFNGQ